MDYCSSNGDDFSMRHWISAPKLSRVNGGSYFHSLLCVGTSSNTLPQPWQIWLRPGGYLGKNLNCIKTRAYLANKRLSIHSQDTCRELLYNFLQIFCAFMLWAVRLWKPWFRLDLGPLGRGFKSILTYFLFHSFFLFHSLPSILSLFPFFPICFSPFSPFPFHSFL